MSTQFVRFQYKSIDANPRGGSIPASDAGSVGGYSPKQFDSQPNSVLTNVAATTNSDGRFRLDANVANQLHLDEAEKARVQEEIRVEIEQRWEKTKEKAEVAGYTAGLELGKKEAYEAELPRIKEKLLALDGVLNHIDTLREKIFQANEAFLMEIVAQVARMVTLKEVTTDQDYLKRVIISLMSQLGTKDDVRVLISQNDVQKIDLLAQAIQHEFGKLNNTVVEASNSVPEHGCKIETRFGVIDASVQTQVENIIKSLKN